LSEDGGRKDDRGGEGSGSLDEVASFHKVKGLRDRPREPFLDESTESLGGQGVCRILEVNTLHPIYGQPAQSPLAFAAIE
jgi:hypothetical protein